MEITSIQSLIDRLEKLLAESFRIPFTTNLIVNEDDFFGVVDQMRTSIPEEIRQARRIQQDRERILAQAQEEANRQVTLAREEAENLVQQSEIIRQAENRAATIQDRARAEADRIRAEADAYVHEVLAGLEEELLRQLQTVQNGLQVLQPAPAEEEPPDDSA